jgi:hypothetical protein
MSENPGKPSVFAQVLCQNHRFIWEIRVNSCTITGWTGVITGIQPNCNGYLVSVLVTPALSSDVYGASTIVVASDYTEQYQVNNDGSFQYLNSLDPQGLAGQLPDLVGQ